MTAEVPVQRHYRIRGRVQGVGFRNFVFREAKDRGVSGWVRNRLDRSVEVLAVGPSQVLEEFETALARGPRWGRVDAVEITDAAGPEVPASGFEIRATV